ncbi:MAG: hypothetical protein GEU98_25895 [Pseudonocardiaceae bacterium]|nr:hypothetical protein [Pseudonocardiaceae bacterium]
MAQPPDMEPRIAALEARVNELAAHTQAARQEATAARHLAAARDRDIADLAGKADANRFAINALGEQTRERFDRVDARFDALERTVDEGFTQIRGRLDGPRSGWNTSPGC